MTLIDHPDNPIPAGAVSGLLQATDSAQIRYAHWPATGKPRKGTVTILQGRAESIEKYFEVVEDLRRRGFAVIAFDWRGQGGSQRLLRNRKKGHISHFGKYRDDLRTVLKKVSLAEYAGPHFALAHSTGGTVLLSDTARLRTMLDRAVITAPLLGLPNFEARERLSTKWRKFISILPLRRKATSSVGSYTSSARNLSEKVAFSMAFALFHLGFGRLYVPGQDRDPLRGFETNKQTSDRGRFERYNELLKVSPEIGIGAPTIGWLNAASRCMLSLRRRDAGPKIVLPCLLIAAGADSIVSTSASEEFASRAKAVGYVEIAGAEHELMMEADTFREQFWAAFDAFVPGAGR